MSECASLVPLVTPYVDGELPPADRHTIEQHLERCPPCRAAVATERAARSLLAAHRSSLHAVCAPGYLKARCAAAAAVARGASSVPRVARPAWPGWRARLAPLAAAAALVLMVGGAFLYQATAQSSRVMAVELAADHLKCFTMNAVLGTHDSPDAVQGSLAAAFGWPVRLPGGAEREGLELVGSRPCLYGEGRMAHIMYRHNGHPLSIFMLPKRERAEQMVEILGHRCAIWSADDRTFVLVSNEGQAEVERLATFVQASMQ
jgi:anti-sigma factor RsiW